MAAFGEEGVKVARQIEFDTLCGGLVEEGILLEDAVEETLGMLEGERDMGLLFVYRTQDEKNDKDKLMTQCKTIERTAAGEETDVNCLFAYQGLKSTLSGDEGTRALRFVEGRNLIKTLIKACNVKEGEGEESEDEMEEEDSDGEDPEEDRIYFLENTLEVLESLLSSEFYQPRPVCIGLSEEEMGMVYARLEKDQDEPRVATKLLSVLNYLINPAVGGTDDNKAFFSALGGASSLDVTAKCNKKNAIVQKHCSELIGLLLG